MLKDHAKSSPPVDIRKDFPSAQPVGVLGYPQGEAMKLNKMASENWQEHLLLFTPVKNIVIKRNPDVYAPFNLEVGKPSPLGLFLESEFKEGPGNLPIGEHALEYHIRHTRSIILCRTLFQDKEGRIYRDVDLKGIGNIGTNYEHKATVGHHGLLRGEHNYAGLLGKDIALYDYKMAEKFLKKGIRACRTLGIMELQEIPSNADQHKAKLSLSDAADEVAFPKDFRPVIEVRAFGTKFRIPDIMYCGFRPIDRELAKLMIADAKKMVSQELGLKAPMSNLRYLEWFAENLGRNIGLMHRSGWEHHYLSHNITLDCRLVDFDGVRRLRNKEARSAEVWQANEIFHRFVNVVLDYSKVGVTRSRKEEVEPLISMLRDSYDAAFLSPMQDKSAIIWEDSNPK